MNEIILFIHIFIVFSFGLAALRLGKEALIGWIALQAVLANLFVIKQVSLFGFEVTCSDAFAIGSIFGLNLLQEYFGRESALRAILISFFSMVFFALMSQIHLFYTPSIHDFTQGAFETLLSSTPRVLSASLITFVIVQQVDLRIFKRLSASFTSFSLKNAFSLISSQFLDTLLFSVLGLYGIVSSLFHIIFISFLLKLLIILCLTPFTLVSKRCLSSN